MLASLFPGSLSVLYFHALRSLCRDLRLLAVSPIWESFLVSSRAVAMMSSLVLVGRTPGIIPNRF